MNIKIKQSAFVDIESLTEAAIRPTDEHESDDTLCRDRCK